MLRGGCLKNGCLGCLGLLVIVVVILGVNALIVANQTGEEQITDRVLRADESTASAPLPSSPAAPDADDKPAPGRGWLILELGQGEFRLAPGEPGTGIVVEANYDEAIFDLAEYSHTWPDSSWVYHVRFRRTISGLQAILREIMGGNHASRVDVFIAPDLPVELNLLVKEGGMEAELGGLWLTDIDLRYDKAGVVIDLDEPLREPLGSLVINGRMGGGELMGIGNASPRRLDVRCRMGGMSVDLAGAWRNDCDARLDLMMGGLEIDLPADLELAAGEPGALQRADAEVSRPVLRIVEQKMKMGEIEIR
jgi:hypothetical protein